MRQRKRNGHKEAKTETDQQRDGSLAHLQWISGICLMLTGFHSIKHMHWSHAQLFRKEKRFHQTLVLGRAHQGLCAIAASCRTFCTR